ncbi:hypothetical protein ABPG75_000242 [Micractinium tetrahymenae]
MGAQDPLQHAGAAEKLGRRSQHGPERQASTRSRSSAANLGLAKETIMQAVDAAAKETDADAREVGLLNAMLRALMLCVEAAVEQRSLQCLRLAMFLSHISLGRPGARQGTG